MNRRILISLGAAVICLAAMSGFIFAAPVDQPTHQGYSAPALYNLGNSYARSGDAALAVLNYERARILSPLDPDIRANLSYVRASAGLPSQSGNWLSEHARLADPNTLYWLGLLGVSLAGTGLLLRRLRANRRAAFTAAAIVGLLLTALSLGDAVATSSILSESVVLVATPASASPVLGIPPLFTLPPAEVVSLRAEHAGFVLIRDPQGREGWVARADVASLIPGDDASMPAKG